VDIFKENNLLGGDLVHGIALEMKGILNRVGLLFTKETTGLVAGKLNLEPFVEHTE
jgi:hypothetical protein